MSQGSNSSPFDLGNSTPSSGELAGSHPPCNCSFAMSTVPKSALVRGLNIAVSSQSISVSIGSLKECPNGVLRGVYTRTESRSFDNCNNLLIQELLGKYELPNLHLSFTLHFLDFGWKRVAINSGSKEPKGHVKEKTRKPVKEYSELNTLVILRIDIFCVKGVSYHPHYL
ncbi:hypothetical protein TNCV_4620781 [Trichonephila clavipes]|nr:hypothetical protein TNCV_4620781 [Trichonephila clavipes]